MKHPQILREAVGRGAATASQGGKGPLGAVPGKNPTLGISRGFGFLQQEPRSLTPIPLE